MKNKIFLLAVALIVTIQVWPGQTFVYHAQAREPDHIDKFLEDLAMCESSNRWGIRILDSNNKYSYGGLQFQLATFREFAVRYKILPKGITLDETRPYIYKKDFQLAVARQMYLDGLVDDHWIICWKKVKGVK